MSLLRGNLGKTTSERSSILNDKSSSLLIQSSQIPVRSMNLFFMHTLRLRSFPELSLIEAAGL